MKFALACRFLILFSGALGSFSGFGQNVVKADWKLPIARVNARVIDEQGQPMSGALVFLGFCQPRSHSSPAYKTGLTDADGRFFGEGHTDGVMGTRCTKDGYYLGCIPVSHFTNVVNERWQPWDATYTSVLRKVENPVPVYAKNFFLKVPQIGKPCGYDLAVGDWVSPWGKGRVPDFVFTMAGDYTNFNHHNTSMKLTFSNPLDGIQPADLPKEFTYGEFIWHRQSPESGYVGNYEQEFGLPRKLFQIPSAPKVRSGEDIEAQKFYFRVRTVEKEGKIVSALYGKLSRGFGMGATNPTNINVGTCYYLNPTPLDRNMEFDLKQNLFKNLKVEEQPRKP